MDGSQAGIRERQAPEQAGKGHVLAGIGIVAFFVGPLKRSGCSANPLEA
jgi:hypothetical protein